MILASKSLRGIVKLKTLCVGSEFAQWNEHLPQSKFPRNVLAHTDDFSFVIESRLDKALDIIFDDQDIDLIFLDADHDTLSELIIYITQVQEIRPQLPIVVFTNDIDNKMRHLMKAGATWHFTKKLDHLNQLVQELQEHVFSPPNWEEIFAQYDSDSVKPKIEPGLDYSSLQALNRNPEDRYIIKRIFAGQEVVHVFRLDKGFSNARTYTVKLINQRRQILKIDIAQRLEMARDKQERLIQPRLDHRIGQIQGKLVKGQHLAGACYTLAGFSKETITLKQFLQDQNLIRRDLIDNIIGQLKSSLDQLYTGGGDVELRYWAPLYAHVLPPELTLKEASFVNDERKDADFILCLDELTTLSAVPGNTTLQSIREAIREGKKPEVILCGFEISGLDTEQGILYLQDNLVSRTPPSPLFTPKQHPVLRFKVHLKETERLLLSHPVLRYGKRVCIRGLVVDSQETILANNISQVTGQNYNLARYKIMLEHLYK